MALAGTVGSALGKCSETREQPERAGTAADREALLQGMLGGEDCDPPEPHPEEFRDYGNWGGW